MLKGFLFNSESLLWSSKLIELLSLWLLELKAEAGVLWKNYILSIRQIGKNILKIALSILLIIELYNFKADNIL